MLSNVGCDLLHVGYATEFMGKAVRHSFFTRPPAEAFVTLRDGKKLRPSGGIIFNYE